MQPWVSVSICVAGYFKHLSACWIPAFAGMTIGRGNNVGSPPSREGCLKSAEGRFVVWTETSVQYREEFHPRLRHMVGERQTSAKIYSVSGLNLETRDLLESNFGTVWVAGEVSNLARPRSGHIYFSLKDADCQVRCAMFRMHNRLLDFELGNGLQVLVQARVSLYPERGEFQLIIKYMEESGAGALRRAFEALKRKLAAEGLFDTERKRTIPDTPQRIGVITSPTGAAIRDIVSVLRRRFAGVPVLVYPVAVQGTGAAPEIARALALASSRADCDVLILARGGGSLEDLWAFNEEIVARAIAACDIPIVAGIGHEVDVTIADLVADQRAATPSAAAELVTPDKAELAARLQSLRRRLLAAMQRYLNLRRQQVHWLARRVGDPRRKLFDLSQRLDHLTARFHQAIRALPGRKRTHLTAITGRLMRHDPSLRLRTHRVRLEQLQRRFAIAGKQLFADKRTQVSMLTRTLMNVGPHHTLNRGYAIITRRKDGKLVQSADQVQTDDAIDARLASGSLAATVDEVIMPKK